MWWNKFSFKAKMSKSPLFNLHEHQNTDLSNINKLKCARVYIDGVLDIQCVSNRNSRIVFVWQWQLIRVYWMFKWIDWLFFLIVWHHFSCFCYKRNFLNWLLLFLINWLFPPYFSFFVLKDIDIKPIIHTDTHKRDRTHHNAWMHGWQYIFATSAFLNIVTMQLRSN